MVSVLTDLNSVFATGLGPRLRGEVAEVSGLLLTVRGLGRFLGIGQHCQVMGAHGPVRGEVVSIQNAGCSVLPFGNWDGVSEGDPVEVLSAGPVLRPHNSWIGRVVNAFGAPVDGGGPLLPGATQRRPRSDPPPAYARRRTGARLETGVASIDVFAPLCRGQRMGIFAGPGVGKSTLIAKLAMQAEADVVVIGLIGERGRELQDFVQRDLGPEGMARSVIVVATSDEPPLTRRQAAWTATSVAEHFRDAGRHVLLILDSVTRFAHAQREIGLAVGEPPAQRSFPPTVFAELPHLVERAGPGTAGQGDITALYTVLAEGDDPDDPISDGVRGMLDGHVQLDRSIAESGRFPAVHLLQSVSRMLPGCHSDEENKLLSAAKEALSLYDRMADLVRLGAYQQGSDPAVDRAIAFRNALEDHLVQCSNRRTEASDAFEFLQSALARG
ncbi:MAG: FliI/YscN family ATPase [Pseudomonadota bacterium]